MKGVILGSIVVALFAIGCGSLPVNTQHALAQDSLLGVQTLGLLAKGVEATADSKIINQKEAHQALDVIKVGVNAIKSSNTSAVATVNFVTNEIRKMPFAAKLDKYLFIADIAMQKPSTAAEIDGVAIVNLVNIFLPSLLGFIQKRREETGQDPTVEELKAHVLSESEAVLNDINVYEATHPISDDTVAGG